MTDDRTEGGRLVHRRLRILLGILAIFIGVFLFLLYDLQIIHGAEYLERSQHKIAQTETVDASRGVVLDSLGRVLVSNRVSYQATLDLGLLGSTEQRNATLKELLALCHQQNVEWNDSLSISRQAPFVFTSDTPYFYSTTDQDGEETLALTRLGKLAVALKWIPEDPTKNPDADLPSAQELLAIICEYFELEGGATEENRAVAGVLYELYLRSKDIYWTSYIFAEDVDIALISVVKERGLEGVQFETTTVRQYNTGYAAHILGRVGLIDETEWPTYKALGYPMNAIVGRDGVEKAFEEYLHGTSGERIIETNTSGKIVSESWLTDAETGEELTPEPGDNVVLTLDIRLQEEVERSLAEHVPTLPESKGAAAVVIDVNDGSVKAMASYPTYDPATYSYGDVDEKLAPFLNRATQGLYAPGSTFKMVTAVGGLEEGIITPSTQIRDTGKYMYYAPSYTPACWIYNSTGGTHDLETVSDAIRDSCNIFFYDVGRRLGIEKLNEYAYNFGLGKKTGIELDEKTGVVAGRKYTETVLKQVWNEGSTLSVAIGQENNQFTPLQLANYIATLVNGGNHYSAHLLKEVKSADFSQVIYQREPELLDRIDIDPKNLAAVKEGMLAVTQSGSAARAFQGLDVKVGAKTGTAQVAAGSATNAVFVAFAPYDAPEIALCIVVEKGGSGSELADIAADIISFYFNSETALDRTQSENTLIR